MQYIVSLLPALACPVGMGLLMWLMMRGSKQQMPDQAGHLPTETYNQPAAAVEPPTVAKLLKRAATFNLLGMCLNWRVVAGLAVVGVIILFVAPQFIWAALPLLIVAACPLSMLFMMRGMAGGGSQAPSQSSLMQGDSLPAGGLTRDERLAELQFRLPNVQAESEAIARQIAEIESPEAPVISEAESVARAADEWNLRRSSEGGS
jgi:hypothetical protein